MKRWRTLIVDDEPAARRKLQNLLKAYPDIEVIGEAEDGDDAIQKTEQWHPDLVFLDIQMPGKNGLEVALATHHLEYALVFVTAYDEYALQAFETHALDYLLKPVSSKRLGQALQKATKAQASVTEETLQGFLNQLYPQAPRAEMGIRCGSSTFIVTLEHVAFIEAEEGFTRLYLTPSGQRFHDVESFLSDTPLDHIMRHLPDKDFLRIHRAAVVNVHQVQSYHLDGRQLYLLVKHFPHKKLSVSRARVAQVKQQWNVL